MSNKRKQADVPIDESNPFFNIAKKIQENKHIHREITKPEKPRHEFHIRAGYCGQFVQFDLLDMTPIEKANDGYGYTANFIDVYSRYAWVFPLKNKSDLRGEIGTALERIRKTNEDNVAYVHNLRVKLGKQSAGTKTPYPEFIYSDKEAVAEAGDFKDEVEQNRTEWVTIPPGDKSPLYMVERFNYTLRDLISQYRHVQDTNRYIDHLPEIVNLYNSTKTKNLKNKSPEQIYYFSHNKFKDTRKDLPPRFKIGDYVRIRLTANLFDKKSWTDKFSRDIYQIVGNASKYRFTIQKLNEPEPEPGPGFKPEQMKKINYDPETHTELPPSKANEEKEKFRDEKKVERFINKEDMKIDMQDKQVDGPNRQERKALERKKKQQEIVKKTVMKKLRKRKKK